MSNPAIDRYERLNKRLKSVSPTDVDLHTVNGMGGAFRGSFHDPNLGTRFFTRQFFVFLWLPVIPLDVYLVGRPSEGDARLPRRTYLLYGRMSMHDLTEVYGDKFPSWRWRWSVARDSWIGIAIVATIVVLLAT